MILYTPLPPELIWTWTNENESSTYQEIELGGINLVIKPVGLGIGKIIQVKSSDPYVYLKPEYQPGRLISLYGFTH